MGNNIQDNKGWIIVHRKIRDNWIWEDPVYLKAWLAILLEVNHEGRKVIIQHELIECNRGQSLHSQNTWVNIFGKKWTRQRVRTFFNLLKNDSMIELEGLRKTTRLTVCNYDIYQKPQPTKNQKRTNKKPQTNNYKELNEKDLIIIKTISHNAK